LMIDSIEVFLNQLWTNIVQYAPRVFVAVVILLLGWLLGRAFGKGISKLLKRAGISDALRKTVLGRALEQSGTSSPRFLELLIRWFVYLAAILAATDILGIAVLTSFMNAIVQYLPNLIAGVFILFFGLVVVDFVGDAVKAIGREVKIEFISVISVGVKLFLYLTVIVIALTTMKIDVTILNEFAKAIAWGAALGIAIGLGIALGWGLKDRVKNDFDRWMASAETTAEKTEDFWSWFVRSKKKEDLQS
jgi:Mechanosensitive ion channel, conserved TM helix